MKFLIPIVAALGIVTACTGVQQGEIDHNAYAAFALSQVQTYNALGVNPVTMDPDKLNIVVALCGTVVGALEAGLVQVDNVTADEVLAYCQVAVEVAR